MYSPSASYPVASTRFIFNVMLNNLCGRWVNFFQCRGARAKVCIHLQSISVGFWCIIYLLICGIFIGIELGTADVPAVMKIREHKLARCRYLYWLCIGVLPEAQSESEGLWGGFVGSSQRFLVQFYGSQTSVVDSYEAFSWWVGDKRGDPFWLGKRVTEARGWRRFRSVSCFSPVVYRRPRYTLQLQAQQDEVHSLISGSFW